MCGICGIYDFNQKIDQRELDDFTDSLTHRGPDGRGIFIDRNIGFGHRRLSILDLSKKAKCPMNSGIKTNNRYWITFNGEIYNFIEIRDELKQKGYSFSTDSDTEVVLKSYIEWGESCQYKFNGMWAFAILDNLEKSIFLSRDRFGIKPLYYSTENGRFTFASELKAFLSLSKFSANFDLNTAKRVLNTPNATEYYPETLMKNIKRMVPGSSLTIERSSKINIKTWWNSLNYLPQVPKSYEAQVEDFRELYFDSLKLRMRSDVAFATSLSGGVDSSAVASSMSYLFKNSRIERCSQQRQKLFVASFPGASNDEKGFAEIVAKKINTEIIEWQFNEETALENLIESIWSSEAIYWGINVPIWETYKSIKKNGFSVSMDGHGADELLGGYGKYLNTTLNNLNKELYDDYHKFLQPTLLRNFDRASMAHGVEVRSPFWDWRLVTYSLALPPESKISNGFTKRILRDSMKGIMPDENRIRKQKIGFSSPMMDWFNGAMKPMIQNIVTSKLWIESPLWNGKQWRDIALRNLKKNKWKFSEMKTVWTFMNTIIWFNLFIEKKSIDSLR